MMKIRWIRHDVSRHSEALGIDLCISINNRFALSEVLRLQWVSNQVYLTGQALSIAQTSESNIRPTGRL